MQRKPKHTYFVSSTFFPTIVPFPGELLIYGAEKMSFACRIIKIKLQILNHKIQLLISKFLNFVMSIEYENAYKLCTKMIFENQKLQNISTRYLRCCLWLWSTIFLI